LHVLLHATELPNADPSSAAQRHKGDGEVNEIATGAMFGALACAAVVISAFCEACAVLYPAYWAPARAAVVSSIVSYRTRAKSAVPTTRITSTGRATTSSTNAAPPSTLRERPRATREL